MNAIALPRIDLNALDDVLKLIDDGLKNGKNLDEMAELKQFLDNIQSTLKLGDDIDLDALKGILEELDGVKNASIHAVDSYHPKFNSQLKNTMSSFAEDYKSLIQEAGESAAIDAIKPRVDSYINNIFNDLATGNPINLQ